MPSRQAGAWRLGRPEVPFRLGQLTLNAAHVMRLKHLSDACGGWIVFDDATEESFVPANLWNSMYSAYKATGESTDAGQDPPVVTDRLGVGYNDEPTSTRSGAAAH
jgi:hypothetical protein